MPDFQAAVNYVIANEGSKFTNDPNDAGGPTKFGITQEDLSLWRKKPVSPQDVENMEVGEAEEIYNAHYWLPMDCPAIVSQWVATAILDIGVLCGTPTAAKLAQTICGLKVDAHMGPVTIHAINVLSPQLFLFKFVSAVQDHYIDIVRQKPSQIEYLKGWIDRSQRLITLMI